MKLKVIIARPGEKAVVEEIDSGYGSLEQIVGGELEFSTPIMNDVVVVCDRQGKKKDAQSVLLWGYVHTVYPGRKESGCLCRNHRHHRP